MSSTRWPRWPFRVAALLFALTYALVPHRQRFWRSFGPNWRGAVVAAGLLLLYELLFPLYTRFILNPGNYGTVAAFAVVILIFFYYLAFILLLGAEINSWTAGQRETATDMPGILHAVQAHRSTRGAAGPTAGEPQEEMQPHPPRALAARLTSAVGSVREGTLRRLRRLRPARPRRPDAPASPGSSP
jgi:Virulence factor BrkB